MKLLILSLVFFSIGLNAQSLISGIEDSIPIQQIQEVNIYSYHKNSEIALLTLPVISITKNELELPSFFTPADALQKRAGISLTRDGIWATSVNIRGLSREHILILADGERIQTATDISAALSTIDLNSLERIDVIKGAASVLYGTGAMGGVVNFITERPSYTSGFEVHGRAGTGFNTVNNLWTSHAGIQVSDNNWYLAANGSYRTADDTKTPGGKLENSQFEDWAFGVQGGMTYDDSQEFLINYQHYEADNVGIPGGSAFQQDARVRYRSVKRNLLSGDYIFYEPTSVLNELRINAYTQNISRQVENYLEARELTILPSSENVTSGAKILTDWDLLSSYRSLIIGAEGWHRKAETTRHRITQVEPGKYIVRGEQPVPDSKMLDLGVFAQYSWKIHPRRLTLDAGLRFDYVRTKNEIAYDPVFTSVIENNKETIDEDITRNVLFEAGTADEFSYAAHIELIYTPTPDNKIVLSLSNSYRVASLEERFKYIDQGGILQIGNPGLNPEKGIMGNFSYHFSGDKFILKTDVFANYLFNLITPGLGNYEGVTAWINTNIDNALFLEAEIEAKYQITPGFRISANAGYTHGRDVKNDAYLPQIPPLKGLIDLDYSFRKLFKASVSANWAAKQWEVALEENETEGYIVFNAALQSGKINLNAVYFQIFAGIDNIFNTSYYNHLRTTRTSYVQEEPGRNIYAKLQINW